MNRKSLIVIMILLLALLTLTACGKTEEAAKASDHPSTSPVSETTETGISGTTQASGSQTETVNTGNGATIIAKSNNAVTDSEKQKILTNLNSEIDNLINSINALDDVQASDLTFE